MRELPQGTVTFAFTDIEGSTSLLKQLGDVYATVLAEHRSLVREAFGAHAGVEIDTQGDAFFYAFARARDAVAAAAKTQRAHAVHRWPEGVTLRVRMGLHTGEPTVAEEGYVGLDVVRAARLCGACRGGQVLLSQATRTLTGSALPVGVDVFPLGERHLKDIDEPELVYELEIEGVPQTPAEDAAPATPAEASTVPAPAVGAAEFERRVEDLASGMSSRIERQVLSSLERSLGSLGDDKPPAQAEEDAGIDAITARAASLSDQIIARIAAALEAAGLPPTPKD
jgi:class 3 adenylate cyclase